MNFRKLYKIRYPLSPFLTLKSAFSVFKRMEASILILGFGYVLGIAIFCLNFSF